MPFARRLSLAALFALSLSTLEGCKKSDDGSDASMSAVAEAGVTSIAGTIDEHQNASFAYHPRKTPMQKLLWPILIEESWAATCSARAANSACTSNKRQVTYDCTFGPNDGYTLKGTSTLTYSESDCSFTTDNDTITRTNDFTRTGPFGGTLEVSSTLHSNYEGTALGGGSTLTLLDGAAHQWRLNIGGSHRILTGARDFVFYNVSVATPSSPYVAISGGLSRASRVIDVGSSITVYHNVAEFKSTFTVAEALTHSATCCYPTGGKITFVNSGSRTDTGDLVFSGCGKGTLTAQDKVVAFEFMTCE